MFAIRKVNQDITYVGADDRRLELFENMFPIARGVSYNAYVIQDEKTALLDTADASVGRQFFENLEAALEGRGLDYLIINHMEPDHCALIDEVLLRYPEVKIVSNQKSFQMISQFFSVNLKEEQKVVVKEGDELSLGKHVLTFVLAPMVHWPEAMVTYDKTDKILFSADAFGTFGANNGMIFNDEVDYSGDIFKEDARRYYTNIVGKYGVQVQAVLKKAAGLDIQMICPLHGPVWRTDLGYILNLYQKWSTYEAEEKGVAVFYSSVYGNTESAIAGLAMRLGERRVPNIRVYDVSKTDVSYLIAETFRLPVLVVAANTYNNGIFPKMENLLSDMKALNVQNKKVAVIENGTWAPTCGKAVMERLAELKNVEVIGEKLTIKSSLRDPELLDRLAEEIAQAVNSDETV